MLVAAVSWKDFQFFKSYRFKTEFQIVAFKELMEKKLIAREKLRPFYNEIRKFQDDLRSDNVIQQLPIVLPALLQPEPPLPEIPVPAPEPVPPVVEEQLPAPATKLDALRRELGHLLFDSNRNNDIECARNVANQGRSIADFKTITRSRLI